MILEYCNGGDISKAIKVAIQSSRTNIKVRGLSEPIVRRVTLHIVRALSCVHERGFVHRDIKS
jgi:serine/threonine protein kinase